MLEIKQLCKRYPLEDSEAESVHVLHQLNLKIDWGASVALLGDSGAGKSTLLHLIAGLEPIDSGEIWFNGRAMHQCSEAELTAVRRAEIGLIFQQFHLIDTLSVADNIRLQANLCGRVETDYEQHLIETLGLSEQLKKRPAQLSRGQQQRVAIARALLNRPLLLLADEPTGSLDDGSSEEVIRLFMELVREAKTTLLMVTHSESMAGYLDQRIRLVRGQLHPCP